MQRVLGTATAALGLAAVSLGGVTAPALADVVNVYSYRQPFLIEPFTDRFTEETGIDVNIVFSDKGLVDRLKREGEAGPADLIFTVDIGRLDEAVEAGVTQGVVTDKLKENVPETFRHPEGHWYGLTMRARVIYASKDRVDPKSIKTYDDIADDRFEGKVCTRSGTHDYQVGLLAAMMEKKGRDGAKAWLEGVKENLARKPEGNDRAQVKAIMEGVCDVAIGNHYYYALMKTNEEQKAWADSANIIFPTFEDGKGTHVNISGMALTSNSPNKENAIKLMEFLASDLAQQMYAEVNFEYPVKPGVPFSGLVKSFGDLTPDTVPLETIARNRAEAIKIVNEVGYNE